MTRYSLPPWLVLSRRRLSPIPLFLIFLFLSIVLTPSPKSLYSPSQDAIYNPLPQSPNHPTVEYSIIVPAYKERTNIRPLVETIFKDLGPGNTQTGISTIGSKTEVLIIDDDSQDGTDQQVEQLRQEGFMVELITRKDIGKRDKFSGLSGAVLRGFEVARGQKLVVMDADLQHPPKTIPYLVAALSEKTPMAIGTRYGKGTLSSKWPLLRRIISWGARMLSRPLTSASDPMTGFFAITKTAILQSQPISAAGFKIALEILLKTPGASVPAEIPYDFGTRTSGSSKLGMKVMVKYVIQLVQLYKWKLGLFFHILVALGLVSGLKALEFGVRGYGKGKIRLTNRHESVGWRMWAREKERGLE